MKSQPEMSSKQMTGMAGMNRKAGWQKHFDHAGVQAYFHRMSEEIFDIVNGRDEVVGRNTGHLDTGEAYDACAVREVREEIGLHLALTPQRLFKIDACQETGWEFCWIYRCESEGPFVLHPDEIETGGWFAPAAVTKWANEKPEDFASCFVLLWGIFLAGKPKTV
jgi:hypothetical protein